MLFLCQIKYFSKTVQNSKTEIMNKTLYQNIGGIFFYILEDANQKITQYLDKTQASNGNYAEQMEIKEDIRMRISELLVAKQSTNKHVIDKDEIDEILTSIGPPESYRIDYNSALNKAKFKDRKLYRDTENSWIGGVMSGLSHHFKVNLFWIRVLMLVIGLFGGFLAYIHLWMRIPEAKTTAEKLHMKGDLKSIHGQSAPKPNNKIIDPFENTKQKLILLFIKCIGLIFILAGVFGIFLLVCVFILDSLSLVDFHWISFANSFKLTKYPLWFYGISVTFSLGIPLFALILLGTKLQTPTQKIISGNAKMMMAILWIMAVSFLYFDFLK